jgi:Ca2+-binding RTX toxin-like protein
VLRSSNPTAWNGIETIVFADGVVRNVADLLAATRVVATPGDDVLTGTSGSDTLTGGMGNDTLRGLAGGDTYVYARGDGVDVIEDTGTATTISLRGYAPGEVRLHLDPASDRLVLQLIDGGEITTSGLSNTGAIQFENGTVWQQNDLLGLVQSTRAQTNAVIEGYWFNETISGGFGNDLIDGSSGADTYLFRRGAGQDRLVDSGSAANIVRLQGFSLADATILRNAADPAALTLFFAATGDRLELDAALTRVGSNDTPVYATFL